MSRSRRADVETAELARRRLPDVLGGRSSGSSGSSRPARAAPADDLEDLEDLEDLDDLDVLDDLPSSGEGGSRRPVPDSDGLAHRVRTFTRGHLGVVLVVVVLALLVAAAGVARARPLTLAEPALTPVETGSTPLVGTSPDVSPAPSPTPSASTATGPVVHVVGAVRRPGIVRLAAGARVADALKAAGGLGADADPGDLNLAQVLLDGQQVVVVDREAGQRDPPSVSEVRGPGSSGSSGPSAAPGSGSGSTGPSAGAKVDLNTATAEQLDGLSGVGPVTAQRILEWRSAHGRFSRIEELQEVDGIGPKTFAELAPQVTV